MLGAGCLSALVVVRSAYPTEGAVDVRRRDDADQYAVGEHEGASFGALAEPGQQVGRRFFRPGLCHLVQGAGDVS